MQINLKHVTPLEVCDLAISKCWDTPCKSGEGMLERIDRVGNKNRHASTLEHIVFSFEVLGVSRALLQELARHRVASYSVKSTRYTLKELKEEEPFILIDNTERPFKFSLDFDRASKYLVFTKEYVVDLASVEALEGLRRVLKAGISNDKAKYCLPEAYRTDLVWTINMRSLQNFLSLRSDKAALWEIRGMANAVYSALPDQYASLCVGSMK